MSKSKGNRYERELVNWLQDEGIVAYRQPLSGALSREEWKGDIKIELPDDRELVLEAKYRSNGSGFKKLYDLVNLQDDKWFLESANLEVVHQDVFLSWIRNPEMGTCWKIQRSWSSKFKTLHGWIDGADWLAVRMPRCPWLFIKKPNAGEPKLIQERT